MIPEDCDIVITVAQGCCTMIARIQKTSCCVCDLSRKNSLRT